MDTIPFARPFIGKEEEEAVIAVLRSGWITTGKETLEFEKEFAKFLANTGSGKNQELFCMAVNSATSGLHLALEACGVKYGGLVLLPSLTFAATAEVVRYFGAEPVFVDVTKGGFHLDPAALKETLERLDRGNSAYLRGGPKGRATALMPVHYGGMVCDMNAINPIAEKYGLKIIEDAAHSFPLFAGITGDVGVFSFYATKTITTGEGGMVVTKDKKIADRIKIMRSHGIDRSIWDRYTKTSASWYYEVVEAGFKYNIPDILSALGRVQLRRAMDLLAMRKNLASLYDEAFKDSEHLILPPTNLSDARHLYPIRLRLEKLSIGRDEFAEKMQEQGIGISVHFIPLHTMPYYKKLYSLNDDDFPQTLDTYRRSISLPLWPGMTEAQVKRVITVVKNLCSDYNI